MINFILGFITGGIIVLCAAIVYAERCLNIQPPKPRRPIPKPKPRKSIDWDKVDPEHSGK